MLDPYFSATKLEWLLDRGRRGGRRPTSPSAPSTLGALEPHRRPDGGVHATEPSNASRTMLFDIRTLAWSDELLRPVRRARARRCPRCGRRAAASASPPPAAGCPPGIPVSGIAGDQQAALFGQACLEPGMTKNTYGTGQLRADERRATRAPSRSRGCSPPWRGRWPTAPRAYALEGAIFVTGAAVQWLRDGLGIIERRPPRSAALAATVARHRAASTSCPPSPGSGSPWWDPYARGTIVGITRGTGRAHLARAVARGDGLPDPRRRRGHERGLGPPGPRAAGRRRRVGHRPAAAAPGRPAPGAGVRARSIQETTALGAAYLAGLAEGVWAGLDDMAANWRLDRTFDPAADRTRGRRRLRGVAPRR